MTDRSGWECLDLAVFRLLARLSPGLVWAAATLYWFIPACAGNTGNGNRSFNLVLTGRIDDFVNIGGTKFAAATFEAILASNENGYDDLCLMIALRDQSDSEATLDFVGSKIVPRARGAMIKVYWSKPLPFVDNGKHGKGAIRKMMGDTLPAANFVSA